MFAVDIVRENLRENFHTEYAAGVSISSGQMRTDIIETDSSYEFYIDLPGCTVDNVRGELKDGYLTVAAKIAPENSEHTKYLRKERFIGSCKRSFYVGDYYRQEDIKAKFENGVLRLSLPRPQETQVVEQGKYITIEG